MRMSDAQINAFVTTRLNWDFHALEEKIAPAVEKAAKEQRRRFRA